MPAEFNVPKTSAIEGLVAAKIGTGGSLDAGLDARYAALGAPPVRESHVAGYCMTQSDVGKTVDRIGTSRASFKMGASDATDIRLGYGGWVNTHTTGDTALTNVSPLPVRAAIEYPAGTITPVFFNGSRDGYIENNAALWSDPVAVDIPADAQFWVRTFANPVSGDYVPQNRNTTGSSGSEGFTATSDLTAEGSGTISSGSTYVQAPFAIRGTTATPHAVALLGDSITRGVGDTLLLVNYSSTGGFQTRAMNAAGFAWLNMATASETAAGCVANRKRSLSLVQGCTRAVVAYGVNDLQVGLSPSFATLAANLLTIWKRLDVRGIKVWQTTLTPNTTSTDSWATTGNQTIATGVRDNAVRILVNDWVRDGAPLVAGVPVAAGTGGAVRAGESGHPLTGYFETADAVESATNSGLWKAGYTGDGLHPNATGHAAMAAVIDAATLA